MLCSAPPINKETASAYAAKSHVARKALLVRLKNESKELAELKAAMAELPPSCTATKVNEAMSLLKLRRQIEEQMDGTTDGKELAQLSAAHARLFSAWCVLTDTKSPGVARGSRRQRPAEVQPIPQESPAPALSKPLGWEYDGA